MGLMVLNEIRRDRQCCEFICLDTNCECQSKLSVMALGRSKLDTFLRRPNPISPPAEAGAAPMQNSAICAEIPTCPSDKHCLKKWALLNFVPLQKEAFL